MDGLLKIDQANIRIIYGLCLLKKDPVHAIFYVRWRAYTILCFSRLLYVQSFL